MPEPHPRSSTGSGDVSPNFLILVVEKGVQQLQCKPESQAHRKWVPQPNQARNDSTPVHLVESLSTTAWKRVHSSQLRCQSHPGAPQGLGMGPPILLILVVEKGTQQLQFKPESQPQRKWMPKPHQACNYSTQQRGGGGKQLRYQSHPRSLTGTGDGSPVFLSLVVKKGAELLRCKPKSQPHRN